MRHFMLILSLFLVSQSFAATEIRQASKINKVAVFKDRAIIQRSLPLNLSKDGAYSVVFEGLTPLTDVDSLKATVNPTSAVKIMGIRTLPQFRLDAQNPRLIEAEKALDISQLKLDDLRMQVQQLNQENATLKDTADHYGSSFSFNMNDRKWSRQEFKNFVELLEKRSQSMQGKWRKIFLEFQDQWNKHIFLQNQVTLLRNPSEKDTLKVAVDVLCDKPVNASLQIEYLVSSVGWTSAYDVRLESSKKNATVEHYAYISQESGEDWKAVSLTLHNSQADLQPVLPSIESYMLSYREVKEVQTTISGKTDDSSSLNEPLSVKNTHKNKDQLAMVFEIPGKHSVLHGMRQSKIFIGKVQMSYQDHLELVAEQYSQVYKKTELSNTFSYNLLPGSIGVYVDGAFVQQSYLPSVAKGRPFSINAGVDHSITASYGASTSAEGPRMLSRKKHYLRQSYSSLTNWGKKTVRIKVLDRLPISEIKDVEVSTRDSTAGFKTLSDYPGWGYWDLELPAGKQKTVELKLDIAVPQDFNFTW